MAVNIGIVVAFLLLVLYSGLQILLFIAHDLAVRWTNKGTTHE